MENNRFGGHCMCEKCMDERNGIAKHLDHPFYKDANKYREKIRLDQIIKGSQKYPEPFNPDHWTPLELVEHAMQENVDQGHYIFGLFEKLQAVESELEKGKAAIVESCDLRREIAMYEETLETVTKKTQRLSNFIRERFPETQARAGHPVDIAVEFLDHLDKFKKTFFQDSNKTAKLLDFIMKRFPDAGEAGEHAADIAIELLSKLLVYERQELIDKNV